MKAGRKIFFWTDDLLSMADFRKQDIDSLRAARKKSGINAGLLLIEKESESA